MMPDMDGHEFLRVIRSRADTSLTPFIFLTAKSQRRDFRAGMDLGADDYLVKPWSLDRLLHAVELRLQRHREWVEHTTGRLTALRSELANRFPPEVLGPLQGIAQFSDVLLHRAKDQGTQELGSLAGDLHSSALRLLRRSENFLLLLDQSGDAAPSAYFTGGSVRSSEVTLRAASAITAASWTRTDDLDLSLENHALSIPVRSLTKIMTEVLDNAFAYSLRGTKVHVSTEFTPDQCRIRVVDHGIGIGADLVSPAPTQDSAQVPANKTVRGSGLAAVQFLLNHFGGRMTLERGAQDGTVVTVTLPR
jgi:signal transduction histidine kinase